MFTSEAEVAAAGMDQFRIAAPFYFMMALFGIFSGVIRGCGQTFVLIKKRKTSNVISVTEKARFFFYNDTRTKKEVIRWL